MNKKQIIASFSILPFSDPEHSFKEVLWRSCLWRITPSAVRLDLVTCTLMFIHVWCFRWGALCHSHLVLKYVVPVWFSACPLIHVYKTSYRSLECACGGRAERPQMLYANDNTSLIHQIKFRRNRYPWAHPLWFVEWSSTWWPMHLWSGLPK